MSPQHHEMSDVRLGAMLMLSVAFIAFAWAVIIAMVGAPL